MKHARGLHEIRGLRSLSAAGSAGERGKLSARLTCLDHQRALLERQLAVWDEKQRVTKYRLSLLEQEITEIGRATREFVIRVTFGRCRILRMQLMSASDLACTRHG